MFDHVEVLPGQLPFCFDGPDLTEEDHERLTGQLLAVHDLMADGKWRTLGEIRRTIGKGSEAGISARLRDLRKSRFGLHSVDRRRRDNNGLFEYRMEEGGCR